MFLWGGYRTATREALHAALKSKHSVYLLVGGEAESLLSERGTDRVYAAGAGRKGHVRLALATRSPLVPMYTFHNTDTYSTNVRLGAGFRRWLSRVAKVCLPIFWGRYWTPLPYNVQLTVAVGDPVPLPAETPANDDAARAAAVDAYHAAYLAALVRLFHTHKAQAGYPPERKMEIWGAEKGKERCMFTEGPSGELVEVPANLRATHTTAKPHHRTE